MSLLAVAFTDLHAHNYRHFDNDGSRLKNCLEVIDDVYKFAVKNKIELILFGGDIVDSQQAVPTVVANALMERMDYWIKQYPDISWLAITGNHDQATRSLYGSPGVSFLQQLKIAFPRTFNLIDDSSICLQSDSYGIPVAVHGIPYYAYPEHFAKALKDKAKVASVKKGKHILLIHQTPSGLSNPNIPVDTNVHDPLYDFFDLVLCGHIHQGQSITEKFYLMGSPLHRDLGDEGDEKGFWVLDLEQPEETLTFVTRKGRYPEFRVISGEVPEEYANDYVLKERTAAEAFIEIGDANIKDFSSALTPSQLLENYWKETEGNDTELLKTGIAFLK